MKKIINLSLIALLMLGITACSDDDKNEPDKIVINDENTTSSLFADQNSGSLAFTATEAWYANVAEVISTKSTEGSNSTTWLELDQYNGPAGTYNLTIILNTNDTQFDRTATITITCGGSSFSVTITQKGTKQDGTKPEAKRLITQITESASFTSDYYTPDAHISEGKPYTQEYTPFTYTFSYDTQNRLKECVASKNYYNSIDKKAVFDYSIAGEIRLAETDNYQNNNNLYRGKLNEQGYITALVEDYENWNESDGYKYDANGYIKSLYDIEDNEEWAFFTWKDNNLITIEENDRSTSKINLFYNSALNNKTNIDLNGFFFGYFGSGGVANTLYNYNNLYSDDMLAMADFFGKRSKNYIINMNGTRDFDAGMGEKRFYNEDNEPEQGVFRTSYSFSLDGDYKYTFDTNDYPITFSYRIKVEKTTYTYNGVREYLPEEEQNEWNKFSIKLDASTAPVKYDTYTYTISYNK